jgi:Family of unknown function (DUF6325)
MMTDTSLGELGPVDYLVVEFPAGASNFTGEMAAELVALVDAGTIRVIDVLILTKNEDGSVEANELSDVEELGELEAIEAQLAELLAEDDVVHLAAAMDPGSIAGVLIWENLWAAPFAAAASLWGRPPSPARPQVRLNFTSYRCETGRGVLEGSADLSSRRLHSSDCLRKTPRPKASRRRSPTPPDRWLDPRSDRR